jgi:hypothetical protein
MSLWVTHLYLEVVRCMHMMAVTFSRRMNQVRSQQVRQTACTHMITFVELRTRTWETYHHLTNSIRRCLSQSQLECLEVGRGSI